MIVERYLKRQRSLTREALARLTEDDRRAIVLRVELGYDYSELAVELGKSSPDAPRSRASLRPLLDG